MKLLAFFLLLTACLCADPLPSWNNTAAKKQIISFVDKVTDPKSPDFVPRDERIANARACIPVVHVPGPTL